MPLSEPFPASGVSGINIANGTVLFRQEMENTGSDTTVGFYAAIYDYNNDRCIIGGDSGYIGFKSLVTDKLVQAPDTTSGNVLSICLDQQGGGIFTLNSIGVIERFDSNLNNSVVVTPVGVTPISLFSLKNDNNVYCVIQELVTPQRNIIFSSDSGLTWDTLVGIFAPINSDALFVSTSPDGTHVAITSAISHVAVSNNPLGSWAVQDVSSIVVDNVDMAAFDNNNQLIFTTEEADTFYTSTPLTSGIPSRVPLSNNPNAISDGVGDTPTFLAYVPAVEGFVMGDISQGTISYFPSSDPSQGLQGVYLGNSFIVPTPIVSPHWVTDLAGNFQVIGSSNDSALLVIS